ncbi:MAG: hypothetical protein WAL32_05885, partial [Terriglobales bacterium]
MLQNPSLTVTASSPLTGGGSVALGGATSLGLKSCSSNQVLEYVSGTWACTNAGTVASVAMTAPSSDFTVSGSPVTGSGTLGLNWTVAPTSANTANAIVKRDSTGSFSVTAISAAISSPTESAISGTVTTQQLGSAAGVYGTGPYGVWGVDNLGWGAGVYGQSGNVGVSGFGAYGVYGVGDYGVFGSGTTGVWGSGDGVGVYGEAGSAGVEGLTTNATEGAVFGSDDGNGTGVLGESYAGYGVVGSGLTGVYGTGTTGNGVTAYNTAGGYGLYSYSSGYTAYLDGPSGHCNVSGAGNLYCTGSKSAVVPVDGGTRQVALYAVEAPENWFEDFGSGRLSHGEAVIPLEPTFAQTVNTKLEYHVFLTPNGDSRGLYVSAKTTTSFEVHEQGGGTSTISFDYRIVARRKGYENIRLADMTEAERPKLPAPKAPPIMPAHAQVRPAPPNIVRPVVSLKHAYAKPH